MNYTTYNGRRYLLSRDRQTGIELVDTQTLELVRIPQGDRRVLGPITHEPLDLIPGLVHFPNRPPEFLLELRSRREQFLKDYRDKKVKTRKVEKSGLKSEPGSPRRGRSGGKKISDGLQAVMNGLSPELQALLKNAR